MGDGLLRSILELGGRRPDEEKCQKRNTWAKSGGRIQTWHILPGSRDLFVRVAPSSTMWVTGSRENLKNHDGDVFLFEKQGLKAHAPRRVPTKTLILPVLASFCHQFFLV